MVGPASAKRGSLRADLRLRFIAGLSPETSYRFGRSRSYRLPSHRCRPCATVRRAGPLPGVNVACRLRLRRRADKPLVVGSLMRQQFPDRARGLVCERDHGDVQRPTFGKAQYPLRCCLAVGQDRPRSVNHQRAQICIGAFADPKQVHPSSATAVARQQPQPGGELASGAKCTRITHRGHRCCRAEHPHPRNLGDAPARRSLPMPLREAAFDTPDLLVELQHPRPLLA